MSDVSKVKQIGLFKNIDEKILGSFSSMLKEEHFSDGQAVFNEDDSGEEMYFILSGEVQIVKFVNKEDGVSQLLSSLTPGDFFGEMALFDQKKRSATARAKGDVAVLKMNCKDFYAFLENDVFMTINVLGGMLAETIRRLRETDIGFVTIYETGRLLASGEKIENLLQGILSKILEVVPSAERGFVALWNEFSEMFELRSSHGFDDATIVLKKDDCLIKWLKENKDRLIASDTAQMSLFNRNLLPKYCGASFVLQPFVHRGELLGFLLISNGTRKMEIRPNQVNLLSGIAAQVAPVIANAKKITEEENRKRLQRAKAWQ
ncbi:MAG: cyclic nucleotide-binding domain-containing protein [Candidatus Omnitrophica bacterium]|nr:cyclic nucleotide-binding domain-containing protein [Candidatus Omnitrophota bacterium]